MGEIQPLTPCDGDLRDFPFTPIFRSQLFASRFHARATDAEWRAGVTLWLKSWDQVPAGSLPDDDVDLCRLAELGRDLKAWRRVREGALHGWRRASDGLLYHATVAEGVNEALARKNKHSLRGAKGAAGKWGSEPPVDAKKRHERLADARLKGTHTPQEWEGLVHYCGGQCLRCGEPQTRFVKDHITPIYQGGSDAIDNLQPLCGSCNSSKGPDRTDYRPDGWLLAVMKTPSSAGIKAGVFDEETPTSQHAERLLTPGNRQGQGQGQEKGQRQKESRSLRSLVEPPGSNAEFDEFWKLYPRKTEGPAACRREWDKARKSADFSAIIAGLERYPFKPDFLPMPATWLNQKRWLTQSDTRPLTVAAPSRRGSAADLVAELDLDLVTPLSEQFPLEELEREREQAASERGSLAYQARIADGRG